MNRKTFVQAVAIVGMLVLCSFVANQLHATFGIGQWATASMFIAVIVTAELFKQLGAAFAQQHGQDFVLSAALTGLGVTVLDLATQPPLMWQIPLLLLIGAFLGSVRGALSHDAPREGVGLPSGVVAVSCMAVLLATVSFASGHSVIGCLLLSILSFAAALVLRSDSELGRSAGERSPLEAEAS
ncbi:MAG: hypothetical protein KatS3mg105_3702 [Gemmatales bacterium]|nr:MAG: hypothetical protein KatS3mg105_3702 [Gemmatales bacterium]